MKKVKITLGIALAMFLMGANGILYGQTKYPVKVFVAAVDTLQKGSSNLESVDIRQGYTYRNRGANGVYPSSFDQKQLCGNYSSAQYPTTDLNALISAVKSGYQFVELQDSIISTDIENSIKSDLGYSSNTQYGPYFFNFEVKYKYNGGNERVPVVKRRLTARGGVIVETTLYPTKVADLTQFSTGSGDAVYEYSDNMCALFLQYQVDNIEYYVSLVREYGEGGGLTEPTVTRFVEFETAGVELFQEVAGEVYYAGQKYGVESHKAFTFYAKASSKPVVKTTATLRDPIAIALVKETDDLYAITIPSVTINQKITVTDPSVEEAGNQAIATEAVWGAGGNLYVQGSGTLSIYSVAGQLLKQVTVSGSQTLALGKGLYIVQLNGKAYKVIL